ncbi:MAG TPA: hypothetical protein PLZ57_07470 [Pseudobdellovibrionaceae bacterium]|nr:hypothetical protein [Pseudobdellovibrionaceae bacterium]
MKPADTHVREVFRRMSWGRLGAKTLGLGLALVLFPHHVDASVSLSGRVLQMSNTLARDREAWLEAELGFDKALWRKRDSQWTFSTRVYAVGLVGGQSSTASQTLSRSSPRIFLDADRSGASEIVDDQELLLSFRRGSWTWRIGSRVWRWGVMDTYDPLDQAQARRYEWPLDSRKLGERSLSVEWSSIGGSLEAYWIPAKKFSILPSVDSVWLPRQVFVPRFPGADLELPTQLRYSYREREIRDQAHLHAAGFRGVWRGESLELAIQGERGTPAFPALRPRVTGPVIAVEPRPRIRVDPDVQLTEIITSETRWGTSVSWAFGESMLRGQVARIEPLGEGRNYFSARTDVGLQLERLGGPVTWIAQVFWNASALELAGNDLASASQLFDRALGLLLRWSPRDDLTLQGGGLLSSPPSSSATQSRVSSLALLDLRFEVSDHASWSLSLSGIEAGEQAPLGAFASNDSIQIQYTYQY